MTDAEMEKVVIGFSIAVEEYFPHELHDAQQLVLVVDQIAQTQIGDFNLLLNDVIDAKLKYCVCAYMNVFSLLNLYHFLLNLILVGSLKENWSSLLLIIIFTLGLKNLLFRNRYVWQVAVRFLDIHY